MEEFYILWVILEKNIKYKVSNENKKNTGISNNTSNKKLLKSFI
jgi:hypothetical protein